jgi:hypothetical protein
MSAEPMLPKVVIDQSNECLVCPGCGSSHSSLHHQDVRIFDRTGGEDSDGVCMNYRGHADMQVRPVGSAAMPGRRHSIEIDLSCEQCGGNETKPFATLRIMQHKGATLMKWVRVAEDQGGHSGGQ